MYIQSNIKERSRKYCCPGEAVSIKHFDFVPVVLLSYQEYKSLLFCAVSYGHLWPVWLYHFSLHYLMNCTILANKFVEYKVWFDFLYTFCVKYFRF